MEIKKILITGSEGYIGSVLAEKLIKKGYQVTGLDVLLFKDRLLTSDRPKYKLIKRDICELEGLDLGCFDAVIHLAALSNDPLGEIKPELTKKINYLATVNLAKKAKKAGVKRFIFSSSCSVYGFCRDVANEESKLHPLTAYAQFKRQAEKELVKLADKNFCVGILRNSTVHGFSPKFRNDLVVNNLTASALVTGEIRVKSDGTPWRATIDVKDLSKAFIAFLKIKPEKINGEIINVGFNQNNVQIKNIAFEVQKRLPNCKIVYTGEHNRDNRSYRVNFDKFQRLFPDFEMEWFLPKSINDLINKLKQTEFSKEDFDSRKYERVSAFKKMEINLGK